jgi:hypothetical protein
LIKDFERFCDMTKWSDSLVARPTGRSRSVTGCYTQQRVRPVGSLPAGGPGPGRAHVSRV